MCLAEIQGLVLHAVYIDGARRRVPYDLFSQSIIEMTRNNIVSF